MGSPRKQPTATPERAFWVVLLIVGMDAGRMAANGSPHQQSALVATATAASACGFLVIGRYLHQLTCPDCRKLTLRRLLRNPRFFRCISCGHRVRREADGAWLDARGPEFDSYYRPGTGNWADAPIAEATETTCGTLLGRKRRRDRSLLALVRDRRKPWSGPRFAPAKGGTGPVDGETTCGALLRSKQSRWRAIRRENLAGVAAAPTTPPLWDRWLDR